MGFLEWPWQHSFPPFFTIQPNEQTRKKQLEAWKSLVLEYHRSEKQFVLDLREAERSPLFNNTSISIYVIFYRSKARSPGKLSTEGILVILEDLLRSGNAEPLNKERSRWYIYWNSLPEWAGIIYNWVQESGQTNTVLTLYEIANTPDQEFTSIYSDVLVKAIKVLERQNKAELIMFDGNNGAKFF